MLTKKVTLKRTPLYQQHVAAGAKMVDFGGWEMPVQYQGILEEHRAVRAKAGLFDVSHMGEIWIKGPNALEMVQKVITNDVSRLKVGQVQYAIMCYPGGGAVDDLLVHKVADHEYLLVVNAANTDKDYRWILEHREGEVDITDASPDTAQVALQGPLTLKVLQSITDVDLAPIGYYYFTWGKVDGVQCLIARTGYTGEDGFELYFEPRFAEQIWNTILEAGKGDVIPVGLGARDTLRFEAGMPLYGHELSENITPLEAGLGRFVALEKRDFIGKEALVKQKQEGVPRKIIGFEMVDRGIPRSEYPVFQDGQEIGFVTSGTFSPTLEKNLGSALVKTEAAVIGAEIQVDIRGKQKSARIIKRPFYHR